MNNMNGFTQSEGVEAAKFFYRKLRDRDPVARARWREILLLARQGDLEAIRAVRLMQSAIAASGSIWIGQINNPRPAITPDRLEAIRQMLIRARNAPYVPPPGVNPGVPGPAIPPPAPPTGGFRQIPGAAIGYTGEGMYQVTKPGGLGLHAGPTMNRPAIRQLPFESFVRVIRQGGNSWIEVDQPASGFVCLSCSELPGGPWLIRKS